MLSLSRCGGESIIVSGPAQIVFVGRGRLRDPNKIRLGIRAAASTRIVRAELLTHDELVEMLGMEVEAEAEAEGRPTGWPVAVRAARSLPPSDVARFVTPAAGASEIV